MLDLLSRITKTYFSGLLLTIILTVLALLITPFLPLGSVVVGISLGIIIGNIFKLPKSLFAGINFSKNTILSWAIIFMGVKLDFNIVKELGVTSIVIIIVSIAFTLLMSQLISKLLGFDRKLGLLLGIGNGICGSSAIAATEKVVGADASQFALSVTIINFLGTIGMFILPPLSVHLLGFNDIRSGFFMGDTLQAVGQVVAAGFSINPEVGHAATIVKMMRILMLTPVVFSLMFFFHHRRKNRKTSNLQPAKKFNIPYFILGFILMSLVPSFHLLAPENIKILGNLSHYLLLVAMVAIGLSIDIKSLLHKGGKALVVGSLIFISQLFFAVLMIEWFL